MITFNPIVPVPVDDLVYDPLLQRERTDMKRASKIAANFTPDEFDPIRVVQRADNKMAIVDGGHRVAAAKILGVSEIPAMIVSRPSRSDEGDLFLKVNSNSVRVNAIDRFRVQANRADWTDERQIVEILKPHGLRVASGSGIGVIGAADALVTAYRGLGEARFDVLAGALAAIPHWEKIPQWAVRGLYVTLSNNPDARPDRLARVFAQSWPRLSGLYRQRAQHVGHNGGPIAANIIVGLYNKGLPQRSRIEEVKP